EHLHTVVFTVGDIDPAVVIGGDVMGDVELAGRGTRLPPRAEQLAGRGELVHPRIAVAIRHVNVALGRKCRVCAAMTRFPAHVGPLLAGNSNGELYASRGGALAHAVIAVSGAIERVVCVDVETVRAVEHTLPPGAQEVSLAVEHHHRMLPSVENVYLVL